MKEYAFYLFDFDNTTFDSTPSMELMLSAGMEAVGLHYDHSMFPLYAGKTMSDIFRSLPGGPYDKDAFFRAFSAVSDSDAYRSTVPFPETVRVLKGLKARGKRIGFASGKRTYKIEELLSTYGLRDTTDVIVGYDDSERHKPDPQPIAIACSRSDIPKADTLYVGDSMNDYLSAHAYGIDVAIVNRGNGQVSDDIPATYTIRSLEELLEGWE